MAMQHWDRFRVAITKRLCRCGELECSRCMLPWRPPEQRTRKELVEDLADSEEMLERLRTDLDQHKKVVDAMAWRMSMISSAADPTTHLEVKRDGGRVEISVYPNLNEAAEGDSCPE